MEEYSWLKLMLEQETEKMTAKQRAVVKAAVELFSEKGYAATSTKEIAQRAGVAEATIFKHYSTKKDLMLSITERIIRTAMVPFISSGISELLDKPYGSREEFLLAFMRNRMDMMREGVPLLKIIFQEVAFQPEIRSMLIQQIQKMPFPEIVEKLREGEITDYSESDVLQIIMTCIFGFFFLHYIMLPEFFPESRQQEDMEALVRFINRGLRSDY